MLSFAAGSLKWTSCFPTCGEIPQITKHFRAKAVRARMPSRKGPWFQNGTVQLDLEGNPYLPLAKIIITPQLI